MCKDMIKAIYRDAEKHDNGKITLITNHLKIVGMVNDRDGKRDESFLDISSAKIWRLDDIYTCHENECKCEDISYLSLDEMHVNIGKIIAFSLVKG